MLRRYVVVPDFWRVQLIGGVVVTEGITVGIVVGVSLSLGVKVCADLSVVKVKAPLTCRPMKTIAIIKMIGSTTLSNILRLENDEGAGRDFCEILGKGEWIALVDDWDRSTDS